MSALARLRRDLRTFSLAIEQPLAGWQADSLDLERRTTVVAPRQSGKSRTLAVASGRPRRTSRWRAAGRSWRG